MAKCPVISLVTLAAADVCLLIDDEKEEKSFVAVAVARVMVRSQWPCLGSGSLSPSYDEDDDDDDDDDDDVQRLYGLEEWKGEGEA